jgi:hypothetical protein
MSGEEFLQKVTKETKDGQNGGAGILYRCGGAGNNFGEDCPETLPQAFNILGLQSGGEGLKSG